MISPTTRKNEQVFSENLFLISCVVLHAFRRTSMLKPTHPGNYPDRDIDCQEAVANEIAGLIASGKNAGWDEVETAKAIAIVSQGLVLELLKFGPEE